MLLNLYFRIRPQVPISMNNPDRINYSFLKQSAKNKQDSRRRNLVLAEIKKLKQLQNINWTFKRQSAIIKLQRSIKL